jgi:hydrogenase nickel incorporation protein HypA/HybF
MHELPVMDKILKIVLTQAEKNNVSQVVAISLRVGSLSDLEDEWMQRYFDYLSKDTIAQGAKLKIERMPVVLQCNSCGASYNIEPSGIGEAACPECQSKDKKLTSGRGYFISNMEVR